jgi:hypothetical protein
MYVNVSIGLEPRLQRRYCHLVEEHLSPADRLAAGLRALPTTGKAFASTQAAWRFFHNKRVTLPRLARPLLVAGREGVASQCDAFVLVVHDWSQLHYKHHADKKDRVELNSKDWGYELQAVLLVSDRSGDPLAVASLSLRAADGVHCSRQAAVRPPLSQLDELAPAMEFVQRQKLARPAVHIVDAEADSVGHYRDWIKRPGRYFLVRADEERVAQHEGETRSFSAILQRFREQGAFCNTREVLYHGKPARQWIAETEVVLARPAQPQRANGQPRRAIPGPPITLRLVTSEVRNAAGTVLAVWFLLSNVPVTVAAETIALWYYWRWRIESYFKLMKSAGQELERWQQGDAEAIARRLLVASMACVVVWQLMRNHTPEATESRELLVRLSGRQMKRTKPFTAPALLAGLWVLLNVLYVLESYQLQDLRHITEILFPSPCTGPP